MNFPLAIKRSWHYFVPPSWMNPRRLVRQWLKPTLFFVLGLSIGTDLQGAGANHDRINKYTMIALVILLLFKFWAGKSDPGDFHYQAEDGSWHQCKG